jgi:hypothetical protein
MVMKVMKVAKVVKMVKELTGNNLREYIKFE